MPTRKMELTKLALDNLRPASPGARYEIADVTVPGLRIRVSDACVPAGRYKGKAAKITFVVVGRFSPGRNPTRRALGRYDRSGDSLSIQAARKIARGWKEKIAGGIDPAAEARELAAASAAAGGRRRVGALLHRRAEHVAAVGARDEVGLRSADRALDQACAAGIAQPQDLALDRADGHGVRRVDPARADEPYRRAPKVQDHRPAA